MNSNCYNNSLSFTAKFYNMDISKGEFPKIAVCRLQLVSLNDIMKEKQPLYGNVCCNLQISRSNPAEAIVSPAG